MRTKNSNSPGRGLCSAHISYNEIQDVCFVGMMTGVGYSCGMLGESWKNCIGNLGMRLWTDLFPLLNSNVVIHPTDELKDGKGVMCGKGSNTQYSATFPIILL